jgi:hypothetical protein
MSYQHIIDLAQGAKGKDEFDYRAEFINMDRSSAALQVNIPRQPEQSLDSVKLNLQGFASKLRLNLLCELPIETTCVP